MPTKLQTEIPGPSPAEAGVLLERDQQELEEETRQQLERVGRAMQTESQLYVDIELDSLTADKTATLLKRPDNEVMLGFDASQRKIGTYTWELTETNTDSRTISKLFVVGGQINGRTYQVDNEDRVIERKDLETSEILELAGKVKDWAHHEDVRAKENEFLATQAAIKARKGDANVKGIGFEPYKLFEPSIYINMGRDMGFGSGYEQPLEEIFELTTNYDVIKASSAVAAEHLRTLVPPTGLLPSSYTAEELGEIDSLAKKASRIVEVNTIIRRAYESVYKQMFIHAPEGIYRLGQHDYAFLHGPDSAQRALIRVDIEPDGSVKYIHYEPGTLLPKDDTESYLAHRAAQGPDHALLIQEVYSPAA
jgi:hypothetical protein